MGLDPVVVADEIAQARQADHPQHAAHDVEHRKARIGHLCHPRHEGREGADEGHEARHDDGDAAMLLIEGVRAVEGLAVEEAAVFPAEHLRTDVAANGVVHGIAQHGGHGQQAHQQGQIQSAHSRDGTGHEQQRVSRQERHHHQPCLDEDDGEHQRIDPDAVVLHHHFQVLVQMQKDVEQGREIHEWSFPGRR